MCHCWTVLSSSLPSFSTSLFPSVLFSFCLVGETRTTSCYFLQAGLNSWTHLILLRPVCWVAVIIDMCHYTPLCGLIMCMWVVQVCTQTRDWHQVLPAFVLHPKLSFIVCMSVCLCTSTCRGQVLIPWCWSYELPDVWSLQEQCVLLKLSLSLSLHLILWHRSFTGPVACLCG